MENSYAKSTAKSDINSKKLNAFYVRSKTRQGSSFSTRLFNIMPQVLASAITQETEVTGIQIGKG